jgi:hypothetical protein
MKTPKSRSRGGNPVPETSRWCLLHDMVIDVLSSYHCMRLIMLIVSFCCSRKKALNENRFSRKNVAIFAIIIISLHFSNNDDNRETIISIIAIGRFTLEPWSSPRSPGGSPTLGAHPPWGLTHLGAIKVGSGAVKLSLEPQRITVELGRLTIELQRLTIKL